MPRRVALIPSLSLTLSLPYLSPYPFLTSHLIPSLPLTLSLPYLSPYPFLTSHLIPSLPLTLSLPYLSPYPFLTSHLIPSLPLKDHTFFKEKINKHMSRLTSHLALHNCMPKSMPISELYARLNIPDEGEL